MIEMHDRIKIYSKGIVAILLVTAVIAGSLLVFIPAVGEFVIPDLLGGPNNLMVGRLLWTEFFSNHDWPTASALAIVMLLILLIPIVFMLRTERREIS